MLYVYSRGIENLNLYKVGPGEGWTHLGRLLRIGLNVQVQNLFRKKKAMIKWK